MKKLIVAVLFCLFSQSVQAAGSEEKFKEIFTAAGYSTILGAAIGAAVIAFRTDPEDNLRLIAMGASVGFFVGLGIGSYFALEPMWAQTNVEKEFFLTENNRPILLKPLFLNAKLAGIGLQVDMFKF